MIKKFILPSKIYLNSGFYNNVFVGRCLSGKCQSILDTIGEYLKSENIKWLSIGEGIIPFCYYVEIDISDDNSTELIKDKGLIPVEKSPYEALSDFDYTAEKYHKEIVKDLV